MCSTYWGNTHQLDNSVRQASADVHLGPSIVGSYMHTWDLRDALSIVKTRAPQYRADIAARVRRHWPSHAVCVFSHSFVDSPKLLMRFIVQVSMIRGELCPVVAEELG